MHRAGNQRVRARDPERDGAVEAPPRENGADPRDAGQPAIERSVKYVEAPPGESSEVEPVGEPRRQAEHALDGRRVGRKRGDGAAHREADEQRPRRRDLRDGLADILFAEVEPLPRLDPVANLGERERGKPGCEPADEPLERGAPRPLHLGRLAAVREHHGRSSTPPGEAQLGAAREAGRRGVHPRQPRR